MKVDEHGGDIIQDILGKLIFGLQGVRDIRLERMPDGFHLHVFPVSGGSEEILREEIHTALARSVPLLEDHIHVSIESTIATLPNGAKVQPRVALERVNISHNPDNQFSVMVWLSRSGSAPIEVTREGAYHLENVIRLAAEATLEAALTFFPPKVNGTILGTKHVEIADENLVVVLLSLHLKEGQVNASGSASTRRGSHIGAVSATLKAINRYLEFCDRE